VESDTVCCVRVIWRIYAWSLIQCAVSELSEEFTRGVWYSVLCQSYLKNLRVESETVCCVRVIWRIYAWSLKQCAVSELFEEFTRGVSYSVLCQSYLKNLRVESETVCCVRVIWRIYAWSLKQCAVSELFEELRASGFWIRGFRNSPLFCRRLYVCSLRYGSLNLLASVPDFGTGSDVNRWNVHIVTNMQRSLMSYMSGGRPTRCSFPSLTTNLNFLYCSFRAMWVTNWQRRANSFTSCLLCTKLLIWFYAVLLWFVPWL
jgi:hypothetical protein